MEDDTVAVWLPELGGWVQMTPEQWEAHPDNVPGVVAVPMALLMDPAVGWRLALAIRMGFDAETGMVPVH